MGMDKTERELHLRLWTESGLNKAEYARQSGLKQNTFYSWCRMKRLEGSEEQHFVEIKKQGAPEHDDGSNSIGITFGGRYNIVVPPGFNRKALQAVLDILEAR